MSVTIRATATKPEGLVFWSLLSLANTEAQAEETIWTSQQPGFISQEMASDGNVGSITVTFDTIEQYRAWHAARNAAPTGAARSQYNLENNITSVYTYL